MRRVSSQNPKIWQGLLVVWFVLLQILLPFLHAHANGQSAHASHGIHLHQNDGAAFSGFAQQKTLKSASIQDADAMVIGVGSGIKEQSDSDWSIALVFCVLVFSLFVPMVRILRQAATLTFIPLQQRTQLNPRAPPSA